MDDDLSLRLTRYLKSIIQPSPLQSAEAFADLYSSAHLVVFRYVYGLSGAACEDAEDITAETFARAWKARDRFNGDKDAALGWLLQIARRLIIDNYRRRVAHGVSENIEETLIVAPHDSPEQQMLFNEQKRMLWELLQALPIEQREMLVMRYMLGWKVNRIADYLGMNENTVSVSIRRTLTRLQRNWPPADSEGTTPDE